MPIRSSRYAAPFISWFFGIMLVAMIVLLAGTLNKDMLRLVAADDFTTHELRMAFDLEAFRTRMFLFLLSALAMLSIVVVAITCLNHGREWPKRSLVPGTYPVVILEHGANKIIVAVRGEYSTEGRWYQLYE